MDSASDPLGAFLWPRLRHSVTTANLLIANAIFTSLLTFNTENRIALIDRHGW